MRAMAVPGGYAPLAAQPEVPPPPSAEGTLGHFDVPDDDEQQGENIPANEGDLRGFNFGGEEMPPLPYLRGTPPSVRHAYAASAMPLLLPARPSAHQASSSHQPDSGMTSTTTYHLPPIPLTYRISIAFHTVLTNIYFCSFQTATVYTADIRDAYDAASSWSVYVHTQTEELDAMRRTVGSLSLGGTRSRAAQRQSARPSESQSVRGGAVREESQENLP
ncbi:hypothetical protein LguiA_014671 [Lonicera macranthoides]